MYKAWRERATVKNVSDGLHWYEDAREEVREIAKESGRYVEVVAAVFSALSPGVRWETNLEQARAMCLSNRPEGMDSSTYRQQRQKAIRILKIGSPDRQILMDILSGPEYHKTRCFFECLVDEFTDAVVIDRWMARAVGVGLPRRNMYLILADSVRELARSEGIRPYQEQAILWCTIKEALEQDTQGTMPLPF